MRSEAKLLEREESQLGVVNFPRYQAPLGNACLASSACRDRVSIPEVRAGSYNCLAKLNLAHRHYQAELVNESERVRKSP
jgi:hypothetical protein